MMWYSSERLTELLIAGETDYVEFKENVSNNNRLQEIICAFSNDLPNRREPGVLVIGVDDEGNCVGWKATDDDLQRLANVAREGAILPIPTVVVQNHVLNGCPVVIVQVAPTDSPPVRCRGCIWVRVGPSQRTASAADEMRLVEKRRHGDVSFDQRGAPFSTIEDLNLRLFEQEYLPLAIDREALEANQRSREQQLQALRFLTLNGEPTNAGIITFGKDARSFIPGTYVQFVRYAGLEVTDPIKSEHIIDGPVSDILRRLDDLLEINVSIEVEVAGHKTEKRKPDFPIDALSQIVRNAILHRSYEVGANPVRVYWFDDRVEVISPGGLYGNVTSASFGVPGITDYRNPLLAEVMKNLGYVQRFGIGIALTRKSMAENGNPEPEFQFLDNYVLVILRKGS